MKNYTTEDTVATVLENSNYKWVRNKAIPNSGRRFRPDFRSDELKIIVEFDGHMHYCQNKNIIRDREKHILCNSMGYEVINIPYFVQMNMVGIEMLEKRIQLLQQRTVEIFSIDNKKSISLDFPHGFITDDVYFPSEYCSRGMHRFKYGLLFDYMYLKDEIIDSISEHSAKPEHKYPIGEKEFFHHREFGKQFNQLFSGDAKLAVEFSEWYKGAVNSNVFAIPHKMHFLVEEDMSLKIFDFLKERGGF